MSRNFATVLFGALAALLFTACVGAPPDAPSQPSDTTAAETQDVAAAAVNACAEVLEDAAAMYDPAAGQSAYLHDFLQAREASVSRYATLDLDGDSIPETVLWLARGSNDWYGFLILRADGDAVSAYEMTYRAFYALKEDGSFSYSSGVADHGIGRLIFTDGAYHVEPIAYSRSADGGQVVNCFIGEESVSKEAFDAFLVEEDQKPSAPWQDFPYC